MLHKKIFQEQVWNWFVNDMESCFRACKESQAQNKLFPGGLCFPAAMTIFAVLEYIAGYYAGRDPDHTSVTDFFSKYMSNYCPQLKEKNVIEKWYNVFRHGLTHQWSPKAGGVAMDFSRSEIFIYTSSENEEIPVLIVPAFFQVFIKALKDYEYALDTDKVLRKNFEKRYNQLVEMDYKAMRSFRDSEKRCQKTVSGIVFKKA